MVYTSMDLLSICVYSISGFLGVFGNGILLLAIKFRSPSSWKFVPFKQVTTSVYLGPCTLISGFTCHIFHAVLVGCILEFVPNSFNQVASFFTNDSPDEVRNALRLLHPEHDQFEEYVIEGHVDIQPRLLARFLQAYMLGPIIPLCIIVFIVRLKVLNKIKSKEDVMTDKTKEMHKSLVKVLTLQASLPILFLASVITFILVKRQIFDSPFLEHSIFWYVSFMPALTPYITLCNVTPFR
ncbi:hypothetical protein PMAYCL1PPCAC_28792, partial [Pristionchus mayeri]